jgi:hypothetical protein
MCIEFVPHYEVYNYFERRNGRFFRNRKEPSFSSKVGEMGVPRKWSVLESVALQQVFYFVGEEKTLKNQ